MTTSALAAGKTDSHSLVEKYTLPIFFLLVLGLTWPFMIVDVLGSHGILPFRVPVALWLVMGYMPTLAAVLMTRWTKGREAVRPLIKKLLIARVGLRWYAFAIFGLAAACIAAIVISNQVGSSPVPSILSDGVPPLSRPIELLVGVTFAFLLRGILNGEELAWRGFALPRLQAKYSALTSSLILSIPWILFHLPLFFTKGSSQENMSFVSYAVQLMATSILFTWMYNNTRGSVLLAYILHAAMNTWTAVFYIDPANIPQGWILTGVITVFALIVVAGSGAENLSRTNTRIVGE